MNNVYDKITLDNKRNCRLAHTNKKTAYFSFHSYDFMQTDGLVIENDVAFFDIGLKSKDKFISRYEKNTILKNSFSSFFLEYPNQNVLIEGTLLEEAFVLTLEPLDKNKKITDVSLAFMCSESYARILDSALGIAGNVSFYIEKPTEPLFLQVAQTYGEKAIFTRFVSFSQPLQNLLSENKKISLAFSLSTKLSSMSEASLKNLDNLVSVINNEKLNDRKLVVKNLLQKSFFSTENDFFNKALAWSIVSGWELVTGDNARGIWAGLPWFRDNWGRDTFIALPGILLVTGQFEEARAVIEGFATYQDTDPTSPTYGRIPNRYVTADDVIYNTVDGSLWFTREVLEFARYTGDVNFLKKMFPVIALSLNADIKRRTDEYGFLTHGDADTWMDARVRGKEPWSPRGNRANDIQALWYTALKSGAIIAELIGEVETKETWENLAQKVATNFKKFFINGEKIADCLLFDGTPDYRMRPNQFMIFSVPFLDFKPILQLDEENKLVTEAVSRLVFPYGVCSLEQDDEFFHPYHDGCEFFHKDAAYHNGTIWGWNAGFVIECLCKIGKQETAWILTQNLAHQILELGCIGSMSENLNAYTKDDGSLTPTGTWSQAWSVSEFNRVAWDCYLGFKPDLLNSQLTFLPRLPADWKNGSCNIALADTILTVAWQLPLNSNNAERIFSLTWNVPQNSTLQNKELFVSFEFVDCNEEVLTLKQNSTIEVSGKIIGLGDAMLPFATPNKRLTEELFPNAIKSHDYLQGIVTSGNFNPGHKPTPSTVE